MSSQTKNDSQLVDLADTTRAIGEVIIKVTFKTGNSESRIAKGRGHFGNGSIRDWHDGDRRNVRPIRNRSIRGFDSRCARIISKRNKCSTGVRRPCGTLSAIDQGQRDNGAKRNEPDSSQQ